MTTGFVALRHCLEHRASSPKFEDSRLRCLAALGSSESPAPPDLAAKARSVGELYRGRGLSLEPRCPASWLLALRAGVLRRAKCLTSRFAADFHATPQVGLGAYARRLQAPTPMIVSFSAHRRLTPQST